MNTESTFDVINQTEMFARLFNSDHIYEEKDAFDLQVSVRRAQTHESRWKEEICSHASVDFNQTLLADFLRLYVGQGVLQSVAKKDDHWQTFACLMWTRRWLGCENTAQLIEHPVFGRMKPFQMFTKTTILKRRSIRGDENGTAIDLTPMFSVLNQDQDLSCDLKQFKAK
jgi:hypothetical protein